MLKVRLGLVLTLVAVLALVGVGCVEIGNNKATGGGWFINEVDGNKITFGFNAQATNGETAKGQFQLIDHDSGTKVHGTFSVTIDDTATSLSLFTGTCSINGDDGHSLYVLFYDAGEPGVNAGDGIAIGIDIDPDVDDPTYYGVLSGGNIQIHKSKAANNGNGGG